MDGLVFDQCICHLGALEAQCTLNPKRLTILPSPPRPSLTVARYLKSKPKDFSLELEFGLFDLRSVLQSKIHCPACKELAVGVLNGLSSTGAGDKPKAEDGLYVEVADLHDNKVLWHLLPSSSSSAEGRVKAKTLTQSELKAKRQAPTVRLPEDRLLLQFLCDEARPTPETFSLSSPDHGRVVLNELLNTVLAYQDQILQNGDKIEAHSLRQVTRSMVRQVEELVLSLRCGYAHQSMYKSSGMPAELERILNELKYVKEAELSAQVSRELHWPSTNILGLSLGWQSSNPRTLCRLFLDHCEQYAKLLQPSPGEHMDGFYVAMDTGRRLYSLNNNSYVFKGMAFPQTLLELFDQSFAWADMTKPGKYVSEPRFLQDARTWASGLLEAAAGEGGDVLASLGSRRPLLRPFMNTLEDGKHVLPGSLTGLFGLGKLPLDCMEALAGKFALAVGSELRAQDLECLYQSRYPAKEPILSALDKFTLGCELMRTVHRVFTSFGDLDWVLARLDRPAKCTALDAHDLHQSVPFQHVLGAHLDHAALVKIELERKEEEIIQREQEAKAAKAQEDLFREEDAAQAASKRKKKTQKPPPAKKPPAVVVVPVVAVQEEPVVVEVVAPVEEAATEEAADVAVAVAATEEEAATAPEEEATAPEEAEWQVVEDEWEEVAKKKPASSAKPSSAAAATATATAATGGDSAVTSNGSNLHFQVTWSSKLSCTVRTSFNASGFIMGEQGKTINQITRSHGVSIDALPNANRLLDFRYFQVKGKTSEQCNRGVDAMKQCVDAMGLKEGPEQRVVVSSEGLNKLLAEGARAIFKIQRDTKCHLLVGDCPRPDQRYILVRGSPVHVANCVAGMKRYAPKPVAAAAVAATTAAKVEPAPVLQTEAEASAADLAAVHAMEEDERLAKLLGEQFAEEDRKAQSAAAAVAAAAAASPPPLPVVASPAPAPVLRAAPPPPPAPLPAPTPPPAPLPSLQEVTSSYALLTKHRRDAKTLVLSFPTGYIGKIMGTQSSNAKVMEREFRVKIEQLKPTSVQEDQVTRRLSVQGAHDDTESVYRKVKLVIGEERTFVLPASLHARLNTNNRLASEVEVFSSTKVHVHQYHAKQQYANMVTLTSPYKDNLAKGRFALESLARGAGMKDVPGMYQKEMDRKKNDTTGLKGLSNMRGENSCFLNVVVQSLFHFSKFSGELMRGDPRQYNQLASCFLSTFRSLDQDDDEYVNSSELRQAVSDAFEGEFELGKMDDAVEAFSRVLSALHTSLTRGPGASAATSPPVSEEVVCDCLVHRNFASYVFQGVHCQDCQQRVPTFPGWPHLVWYVSALELLQPPVGTPFVERVRQVLTNVNPMTCPKCDKDGRRFPIEFMFTKTPSAVFSLGMVWSSEQPDLELEVKPLLQAVELNFDLSQLFALEKPYQMRKRFTLRGVICFSHKHYIAMFRKRESNDWFEFDDSKVKPVGPSWQHASRILLQKQFHPVIIFFEEA